jgi:hypothetical protein
VTEAEIDEAIERSPLRRGMVALLALAAERRQLTPNGNLRLADGRAVAEAMNTADLFDPVIGGRWFSTKSTSEIEPVEPDSRTFAITPLGEWGVVQGDGRRRARMAGPRDAALRPNSAVDAITSTSPATQIRSVAGRSGSSLP